MGTVYKATRRADARQVVVKVRNVIDDKAPQTTGGGGGNGRCFEFCGLDGCKMMSVFKWVVCWIGWTFVLGKVWK